MKIRIGDRVRLKHEGEWGTVVSYGHSSWTGWRYEIRLDVDGVYALRTGRQIEKLPRYRGFPEARDMATAMRHLQEYMK